MHTTAQADSKENKIEEEKEEAKTTQGGLELLPGLISARVGLCSGGKCGLGDTTAVRTTETTKGWESHRHSANNNRKPRELSSLRNDTRNGRMRWTQQAAQHTAG